MSEDTDVIAAYVNGITLNSYFDTQRDAAQVKTELAALNASLAEVQALSRANINRLSEDSLTLLNDAVARLDNYAVEQDAAERQSLANGIVADADAALSAISQLITENASEAPPESLAYGFGLLHYTILARQAVADIVQDGPYGAPGLLENLTAASRLLYNDGNGDDIYSALLTTIAQQVDVVNLQGTSADDQVSFTIFSGFGELSQPITIQRAEGQSDAEFEAVISQVTVQQLDAVFQQEQENISADTLLSIAEQVTAFLPASAADVPGALEQIGDADNNTADGTALAEYFSGLGGDDVYTGGAGPDALSGGDGNDVLRGGEFRDVLTGGAGNDVIFGNATRADTADGDVARFTGLSTDHSILGGTDYAVVIGADGSRDKLFDVSFLRFDDGDIALEAGNALDTGDVPFATLNKENFDTGERVALLYEAALNRNGDIDLPGLNFYVDVTERDNLSDEFLAADLMTSQEFTDNFGDANTLSNQAFLEQIYLNVLDRPSDADGLAFYLGLLNEGTISKALALADIAVSPENTTGSAEILQSLYETTAPEIDSGTGIAIDWSFVG